jgi:exodeoxyribonuclease-1
MPFIFYDTETTGTNDRFDQILQFAAIYTDDELTPIDHINLRCRIKPYLVPSPTAMMITRVSPADLENAPLSHYDMLCAVRHWIQERSPAIILGHNSIGFDEAFLRQGFYKTLNPIYLTNTRGNRRADTMRMAQAAHILSPAALQVTLNERGNPVFKLGMLACANGINFNEDEAHDALFDVNATVALARHLRDRAPLVWRQMLTNGHKADANTLVRDERAFIIADVHFGRPAVHVVTAVATAQGNDATWAAFDLTHDPAPYLAMDPEGLAGLLRARGARPIRLVRTNNQPMAFPLQAGTHILARLGLDPATVLQRAAALRGAKQFCQNLSEVLGELYADAEPSAHVEDRIFDGFPSRADERLQQLFADGAWEARLVTCRQFADNRLSELGHRLIFAECPHHLPLAQCQEIARAFAERALSLDPEAPWTTVASARTEIGELRDNPDLTPADEERLDTIARYIDQLEARFQLWADGQGAWLPQGAN